MRRSAQAKGIRYDNTTSNTESAEHWLFDPEQLVSWQGELVDDCHAISEQLGQIRNEMRPTPPNQPAQNLRVVGRG